MKEHGYRIDQKESREREREREGREFETRNWKARIMDSWSQELNGHNFTYDSKTHENMERYFPLLSSVNESAITVIHILRFLWQLI